MSNEVEIIESEETLEKEISSELVKYNVTDAVIEGLKEKFLPLVQRGKVQNKEEFSEVIDARKECKTWRVTTTKICKNGREKAVKVQKAWIRKEGEVIARITEIESPLEKLEDEWTTEQERVKAEKKRKQEEQLANRQQDLSKMGVIFSNGSFELGDVSYEYALVKESDESVYQTIYNAFKAVFDANEAERLEKIKKEQEAATELQRQKDELAREQKEVAEAKAEIEKQRLEVERKEQERIKKEKDEERKVIMQKFNDRLEKLSGYSFNGMTVKNSIGQTFGTVEYVVGLSDEVFNSMVEVNNNSIADRKKQQEEKRLEDIEAAKQEAIKKEQARKAEEERLAEVKRKEEEAKKAEELAKASDKVKYADLIAKIEALEFPDMRSGQYRKKVAIIREKIEEIKSL